MTADLSQFYQTFFDETAEHLAGMEKLLLALDVNHPAMDDLNAIFRAAHSIKGGAATFGFDDMTEVTHVLETLLDKLRKQEMILTAAMVNAFLEAGDVIAMQLAAHSGESEAEVDAGVVSAVRQKLEQFSGAAHPSNNTDTPASANTASPSVESGSSESDSGFFDDEPSKPVAPPVAAAAARPPISPTPPLMKIPGGRATHEIHGQGFGFFDDEPASAPKPSLPANASAGREPLAPPVRKEIPKAGMDTAPARSIKNTPIENTETDFGLFETPSSGAASTGQNSNSSAGESDAESAEEKEKRDFHGKGFGLF